MTISYEPFHRLIVSLQSDGLQKESVLLQHLICDVAWTTGSELVGELGSVITRIDKEHSTGLSPESKSNLIEAMRVVRRVWASFPE